MTIPKFRNTILVWYAENRRDLPWRNTYDPYKILVSEIMLQQTQIARVLPKYQEFLKSFPDIEALARAKDKKLLTIWAGLGYWRRAKFFKETAKRIIQEYRGEFPRDPDILETFPGIGHYTARALACFAFGRCEAFLDTNIRRVYLHFFFPLRPFDKLMVVSEVEPQDQGKQSKKVSDKEILAIAQKAIEKKNAREWHYALFDYGALVLKDKRINRVSHAYHKQSKFQGSFRSFRTKVMRFLLSHSKQNASGKTLRMFLKKELRAEKSPYSPHEIIITLVKDGLVKKVKDRYFI